MKEEENEISPGSSVSFNVGLCSITQCNFSQMDGAVGVILFRLWGMPWGLITVGQYQQEYEMGMQPDW